MRDNIANPHFTQTLSLGDFRDVPDETKRPLVSVSSNVYYGYQAPLRPEDMHTADSTKKDMIEMDTTQAECHPVNRKRRRDNEDIGPETWKRKRQNEPSKCSAHNKTCLEEDLLRETHGCSYYHWISSSI